MDEPKRGLLVLSERENEIIHIIKRNKSCTSGDVVAALPDTLSVSLPTVKRSLAKMVSENLLTVTGQGRSTRYEISPAYELLRPIDADQYYEKEIDEREIRTFFNWELVRSVLGGLQIFSEPENLQLNRLQEIYLSNIATLSRSSYRKELERLAIDLSWKSSQIEGNTYSLLETERLLKEKETASGKTKDEAIMLLNHKEAIDFIVDHRDYLNPLSVSGIEDIHRILVKDLDVDKNLRTRRVGISGTNYQPLDNEFQIREAAALLCDLVNEKADVFEKAFLALILISYIQPFMDGNKRTARIVSNALLMGNGYCPISFRTVDSGDYKKAMLLFYEQNNISNFKEIFIDQFEFAVSSYF
ncbi:MAG: Fic family protein [Clostridiales Family XIII bacterium]|jgi:Fic family protein|nr:Fic family protein [Clostridiales Family XIII bacterium]